MKHTVLFDNVGLHCCILPDGKTKISITNSLTPSNVKHYDFYDSFLYNGNLVINFLTFEGGIMSLEYITQGSQNIFIIKSRDTGVKLRVEFLMNSNVMVWCYYDSNDIQMTQESKIYNPSSYFSMFKFFENLNPDINQGTLTDYCYIDDKMTCKADLLGNLFIFFDGGFECIESGCYLFNVVRYVGNIPVITIKDSSPFNYSMLAYDVETIVPFNPSKMNGKLTHNYNDIEIFGKKVGKFLLDNIK